MAQALYEAYQDAEPHPWRVLREGGPLVDKETGDEIAADDWADLKEPTKRNWVAAQCNAARLDGDAVTGESLFGIYRAVATGKKSYSGDEIPQWGALLRGQRNKWEAAACHVRAEGDRKQQDAQRDMRITLVLCLIAFLAMMVYAVVEYHEEVLAMRV